MAVTITVNGRERRFDGDPDMPLLWYLRDGIGLVGTKFGCGIGSCGACTVHIDGAAQRSCVTPIGSIDSQAVTTIEGLAADGTLHPVQQAWIDEDVAQCGYCQGGQIMAAVDLLNQIPDPSEADIRGGMNNFCRCGTYARILCGIRRAVELKAAAT
jgi:isoquinoline 1-oxidoreductase alpha subunit